LTATIERTAAPHQNMDPRDLSTPLPLTYSGAALARRVARLREQMAALKLDAMLISHPANRRYLSGFLGFDLPPLDTAGWLLIPAADLTPLLITDFRYLEQANREMGAGWEIHLRTDKRMSEGAADMLAQLPIKRLGFEADHLLFSHYAEIRELLPQLELAPTRALVEEQRVNKDDDEMRLMRRVCAISDAAFDRIAPTIRPGMSEKQVAWAIETAMHELGADAPSFPTIVAGGPNGAQPHAIPSDRPLREGEPIVIDMGALYAGYCSDMTRTICLGTADDKFNTIYNIVQEAQRLAEAACKPGLTGAELDAVARDYITLHGYGDYFGHGLGHGTGLEVHEPPSVRRLSKSVLTVGMVHSVEPGIYLPDWGGVRIEDLVCVRENDCEVLVLASRQNVFPID
jgi:Xaa-Pro aminopeptidase